MFLARLVFVLFTLQFCAGVFGQNIRHGRSRARALRNRHDDHHQSNFKDPFDEIPLDDEQLDVSDPLLAHANQDDYELLQADQPDIPTEQTPSEDETARHKLEKAANLQLEKIVKLQEKPSNKPHATVKNTSEPKTHDALYQYDNSTGDLPTQNLPVSASHNENRRVTIDANFLTNQNWRNKTEKALRGKDVLDYDADATTRGFAEDDVEIHGNNLSEYARTGHVDIVTRFLRIVESQHLLGENCTAGTDLNLGEGVVDRYAQERFRVEADVAVNRANMLTRLWKYSDPNVVITEYLLHASVFSMVEFDDDIFAAGNCYDQYQYKDYWLFCPYAYRLPEGTILVKDLAVEYKYLSNTSEWFYIARKNAENVIKQYKQFSRGK